MLHEPLHLPVEVLDGHSWIHISKNRIPWLSAVLFGNSRPENDEQAQIRLTVKKINDAWTTWHAMMNPPKKSNNISKRKRELMEIAARMKSELGDDSDDGKPDCDAQPKPQDSTAAKAECILEVHGLPLRVMRSGKRLMLFADTGNVQTFIDLFKKLKMSEDSEPEPCVQQEESSTSVISWRCDRRCYIVRFVGESGTTRTKEAQAVNYCDAAGKPIADEQALLEARIRANIQAKKMWNLLDKSDADRFDA